MKKIERRNNINKTINLDDKKIIINYMKEWNKRGKNPKNPFVQLSKQLKNRYEPKAICNYWWNMLDPHLDHEPFTRDEKEYIYKWVENHQKSNGGNIQWKFLQPEIEKEFGKFRSLNGLKNIWNVKKRQLERTIKDEESRN
ncbi:unnamed protein product [Rhizophagus irregularis]|uniref:HTH myb-type domain-containing protein n=1 Tax=Rhizophagus irregularis TaxID=588596 RepID=A0A2I1G8W5_9GLOM|nr:hypothetical protein RhiirA4_508398 [Rhizophagus irregularis]CAB4408106.1 unnamed protein product [Rhizophagus irregularis]